MTTETITLANVPTETLKAEIEARLRERMRRNDIPTAPEGFKLSLTEWDIQGFQEDPDYCGDWQGPALEGGSWRVQTFWTPETGVTFYVDGDRDNAIPQSQAAGIAEALARVAELG